MKVSDLMQALSDAGAPMEAILIAVRALEEERGEIEKRRAGDRERKRRQRAKPDNEDGTVTGQSRDMDGTVTVNPSLSLPPNEINSNPPTHTHPDNKPAREGKSGTPAKPEGVSEQTWADFRAHRRAKKAPLTVSAMTGITREAEKAGWALEAALIETMASGWQSFKAQFVQDRRPPGVPPGRKPSAPSHLDHYLSKQTAGAAR